MSPYLVEYRLQDLIAAIQVMGSYPKFTSRESDKWEAKLGKPKSGADWYEVCSEHPEFFRTSTSNRPEDQKGIGLRLRWALDEDYSPGERVRVDQARLDGMTSSERRKLTRPPLEGPQIEALIGSCIELHSRALAQKSGTSWPTSLVPAVTGLAGVALGFLGAWLQMSTGA